MNNTDSKQSMIFKDFKDMNKVVLTYYILAFVVLFFKIFTLQAEGLTGNTYRIGLFEFASGIGWIYYLANVFGILSVSMKMLGFLENIAVKVISIVNLLISTILLLKIIPDAIRPTGSIVSLIGQGELGLGFWLILGLHIIAVLGFWFKFIRNIQKKNKEKALDRQEIDNEQ